MLKVGGRYLRETPVLFCSIVPNKIKLDRISALTYDLSGGLAYMPCFPPFHKDVLHDLKALWGDEVEFTDSAKKLIEQADAAVAAFESKTLPPGFEFKTKPFRHQRESLLRAIYYPRQALLLDPGTGKSKIAIDTICALSKPTLLLVPPSLVTNWMAEIDRHASKKLDVLPLNDTSAKTKKLKLSAKIDADILLVGYETAARYMEEIWKAFEYSVIVCDELHRVKGWKSQRTQAAIELAKKAHWRIGMTGTMSLGKPEDVYPQLHLLSPHMLNMDYYAFQKKFLIYAEWNAKYAVGVKNLDQLNKVIRKHSIKYTLEECVDLPERQVINRPVSLSKEQWKLYKDVLSDQTLYLEEGIVDKEHKIVALGKLSQLTSGFMYVSQKDPEICNNCQWMPSCVENSIKPYTQTCHVVQKAPPNKVLRVKENPKLDMLMEILEEINQGPENKTIVWTKYVEEVLMIEERLIKEGIGYCLVKDDPLNDIVPFQKDPNIRVLLANQSQGTGYTVNEAAYSIYFSLSYNLEHVLQSRARNRRIGQDKRQILYNLVATGTVDVRIVDAIETKTDIVESLLSSLTCLKCDHLISCTSRGIKMYGEGCVLKSKFSVR